MSSTEKQMPVTKNRVGRFQVTLWKRKCVLAARGDCEAEREVEMVRACVQYSRYNRVTRTWDNQSIWCSPDELRDLAMLLDTLGHDKEQGQPQPGDAA